MGSLQSVKKLEDKDWKACSDMPAEKKVVIVTVSVAETYCRTEDGMQ